MFKTQLVHLLFLPCSRMDISHFSLSGAAESNISFRSVVIIMIYAATIILSLSAGSMDERLYLSAAVNVTVWEEELVSRRGAATGNSNVERVENFCYLESFACKSGMKHCRCAMVVGREQKERA